MHPPKTLQLMHSVLVPGLAAGIPHLYPRVIQNRKVLLINLHAQQEQVREGSMYCLV